MMLLLLLRTRLGMRLLHLDVRLLLLHLRPRRLVLLTLLHLRRGLEMRLLLLRTRLLRAWLLRLLLGTRLGMLLRLERGAGGRLAILWRGPLVHLGCDHGVLPLRRLLMLHIGRRGLMLRLR